MKYRWLRHWLAAIFILILPLATVWLTAFVIGTGRVPEWAHLPLVLTMFVVIVIELVIANVLAD